MFIVPVCSQGEGWGNKLRAHSKSKYKGSSYHMAKNHDWFNSFKVWSGTVKIGDDYVTSIKGSGTMKIKMHDGMVRKLDC